ncbi:piggyBac transposable element-derived protein 4 [Trichonephila clavipes]|nr:piggyBac transposable element-derived protein 4 [Trichonephila clavipes]
MLLYVAYIMYCKSGGFRSPKQLRMELIEKIISENHRDDYSATSGRPSISPSPLSLHAEIVEVEIEVVSPSIVPSGNFAELNRTVTCMVLKANDRRTSYPCHDEFRGPRSDYVREVASENNNNNTSVL